MTEKKLDQFLILGVPVYVGGRIDVAKVFDDWLKNSKSLKLIFTPNPEMVVAANKNEEFKNVLNMSDMNICDGVGLLWAEKKLTKRNGKSSKMKERVAGVDAAESLCLKASQQGKKVFLVGGRPTMAKKAATYLSEQVKDLEIMGVDGPADASAESKKDWEELRDEINNFKPAVLLVAFGAPRQETWLMEHKTELDEMGVEIAMVVGGSVDVWAGEVSRAPLSWQKNGLEWLWRLLHQPWRLGRQIRLIKYVWMIINSKENV